MPAPIQAISRSARPTNIKLNCSANALLPAGAVIAYQHGGGAGFEPALLRDPEAVKDDVLDEIISVARAREKYGVIFTGTVEAYDLEVDVAATTALRARNERGESSVDSEERIA